MKLAGRKTLAAWLSDPRTVTLGVFKGVSAAESELKLGEQVAIMVGKIRVYKLAKKSSRC